MAEGEKSPVFKLTKSIPINGSVEAKFTTAKEATSGVSEQFKSSWNLYPIEVENVKVFEGKSQVDNYSGEAVMFVSDKQSKEINKTLKGRINNKVRINRTVEDGAKGPFNKFSYEIIEEGEKPSVEESTGNGSNEDMFKADYIELYKSGDMTELSEEEFLETATSEPYNINKLRAKKLFKEISKELEQND